MLFVFPGVAAAKQVTLSPPAVLSSPPPPAPPGTPPAPTFSTPGVRIFHFCII